MKRIAVAVACAVLLAGCTFEVSRTPPRPAVTPVSAAELIAAREAAGIADCPVVDPDATPIAGGLPAVTLECLGSERSVNLAGLRGRPMIINLWAQWCPPCRQEAPLLRDAAQRLGDRVLWLGIDYDDPQPDWAVEFAGLVGWRYAHLVDRDRTLAGPLQMQGIPMTLFVDAEGRIVHRHAGPFTSASEVEALAHRYLG